MTFLWPWAFAALLLPLLVRFGTKPLAPTPDGALRVPFFAQLSGDRQRLATRSAASWLRLATATVIWVLLVAALARPALVGPQVALPAEGRDIMIAIDLSGSMGREDFASNGRIANRLDVVKEAADDFISRRVGDRIGLILFSDRAYVQAPLTPDRDVVRDLLDDAQVGLTGTETAIGDAIAIAIKRLKDRPSEDRVLILLTDGANNAGVMQPLEAATLASNLGVRIYTIGVGAEHMQVNGRFGRQIVNPSQGLDEETLTGIAEQTGGQYFRATDVRGLASIYRQIDQIEPVADLPQFTRPAVSLFHWPLGLALGLTALMAVAQLGLVRLARKPETIS
ncbi:VWA domain-containing protein [Pseudoruegeria sp. SK021]|uniref:VWA domain-containing protein n=1 Tax=Pseudoruegeria sp. SK021 TaxID=1933035 RepID=UPI000A258DE9|nr:VWA domain-containing protein [Pseudoruegeria sp. SK021]OSP55972.1 BatB protein [Pseudoruegeria sp. SK021]